MAKLSWDQIGARYFETGVDRGVLYVESGAAVAWNGLVSISENPSGGEATPYYSDGIKYLNVSSLEDFGGTINAYTYPDEFSECDGTVSFDGLSIHQQNRKPFGLSYRTRIGNDLDGRDHAYKIHIVYNALVAPSQNDYETINEDSEALTFSWEFTTTPIEPPMMVSTPLIGGLEPVSSPRLDIGSLKPLSHITIDSRKTELIKLRLIEDMLYGTSKKPPKLPTLNEIFSLMEGSVGGYNIMPKPDTGLSLLIKSKTGGGDLIGEANKGKYDAPVESRLRKTSRPGLYTLE